VSKLPLPGATTLAASARPFAVTVSVTPATQLTLVAQERMNPSPPVAETTATQPFAPHSAQGVDIDCASARPEICILARLERKTLTFFGFDHRKGQGAEIARMEFDSPLFPVFSLSPDGTEIAVVDPRGQANRIRRIPLKGGAYSEVEVSGRKTIDSLFWAADGKSWFVSTLTPGNGEYPLHVNAQGESHVLLEEPHDGLTTLGVPSHNGKQLAFLQWTAASNVWTIDNF